MRRCAGILFTNGNKILLLKRSDKEDNPNTWGLPGGKVKKNESYLEGAIRESKEECGKFEGSNFDSIEEKYKDYIWKTFFFKIKKPFKIKISDEHIDYGWFDIDEINELNLHPKLKSQINKYIKIIKKYNINFKEWSNLQGNYPTF